MASSQQQARRTSAIDLLVADHRRLRTVLGRLERATTRDRRTDLLARTKQLIVPHVEGEEAVFYPAFREVAKTKADRGLFFEAHEEHHLVAVVIEELEGAVSDGEVFAAKAKVLKELVEHHAEEEEKQMFPRARKLLGAEALNDLGARLVEFHRTAVLAQR